MVSLLDKRDTGEVINNTKRDSKIQTQIKNSKKKRKKERAREELGGWY